MIKSKKQMFIVVGVFALVLMLGTVTYAFFNYTRTGSANTIRTGRIAFNSTQGQSINLTNVFPIDVTNGIPNNNANVGSVTINVTGDTTYTDGVEYLVSAVNVQNTIGSGAGAKTLPISIDVSVASNTNNDPATTLGTADSDYFTNRGSSASTSIYKVLAGDVIANNDQLVVGYIKSGATGVDGNIVIRAYIDKAKVAISDTYPEQTVHTVKTTGYSSSNCETALTGVQDVSTYCATASSLQSAIDGEDLTSAQITLLVNAGIVEEYTDGTSSSWVGNRTVFTTTEWNSLQTNGVSFQVKVESNEGIWVESPNLYTLENMCPNCSVFTMGESNYINSEIYGSLGTNYFASPDANWTEFFGHVMDGNIIKESYSCGVNINDTDAVICLRGGVDETLLTDKPIYTENIRRINSLYSNCNALENNLNSSTGIECDDWSIYAYDDGTVQVGPYCTIFIPSNSSAYYSNCS